MAWTTTECLWGITVVTVVFALGSGTKRHLIHNVDLISFILWQYSAAIIFGVIVWMSTDFPILADLDSTQYFKAFSIFSGGFVSLLVDFLLFAAVRHLNSFVVMGTYLVLSSPLGVILNYFVESENINEEYLFGGTAMAFVGLLFVLLSNYLLDEHRILHKRSDDSNDAVSESSGLLRRNEDTTSVISLPGLQLIETSGNSKEENFGRRLFWYWILICTGVIGCSWSVLPSIGVSGTDGITDTSLVILIFFVGAAVSVPACLFLFCYLEICGPDIVEYDGFFPMLQRMCSYSWYEIFISLVIGLMYGVAYVCYFYSTVDSSVPTAVSMALYMFAFVITSLGSIFIFGDYADVVFWSWPIFYLGVGMLLYVGSIFTIVSYSFVT